MDDKLSIRLSTSLPLSRLLALSQSISRLQSTGNDVTGSPQDTWYWQEGAWTCAISCKCQGEEEDGFAPSWMGSFVPGVDHNPWRARKKGGTLEVFPFATRNELMGVLRVKRIILGLPSTPPPFFLLAQKISAQNLGDDPNGDYLSEASIENRRIDDKIMDVN